MSPKLRFAVFGTGRMGRRHLQVLKDLDLELAGVCDPRQESLDDARKESGVPADLCFTDPAALLEKKKPDGVIIATTAPAHCPITLQAAAARVRFVLSEKPLATSIEDCSRMIDACRKNDVKLAVNHQMRFMEQYLEVRRIITSEAFGGWTSMSIVSGNLGLAMNGTHYFELFRWMSGRPLAEVSAWFSPEKVVNPRGAEFLDWGGIIRGSSADGKRFYIEAGADQGHGVRVTYAGRNGIVVADELGGRIDVSIRKAEHRALPTTRYGMPADEQALNVTPADAVAPSRAVLKSLIDGVDFPTGDDGRAAVSTLIAAVVSSETNHASVPVDDAHLPVPRRVNYA